MIKEHDLVVVSPVLPNVQYIEMCEKAVEIQDSYRSRVPVADDIFVGKITRGSGLLIQLSLTNKSMTDDYIWIPRQDQLQRMVIKAQDTHINPVLGLILEFKAYVIGQPIKELEPPHYKFTPKSSMEHLWLAFVMYMNFDKVWDSDKNDWSGDDNAPGT